MGRTLALLAAMGRAIPAQDVISYNAAISGCGMGAEWAKALALLSATDKATLELDAISYLAAISVFLQGAARKAAMGSSVASHLPGRQAAVAEILYSGVSKK